MSTLTGVFMGEAATAAGIQEVMKTDEEKRKVQSNTTFADGRRGLWVLIKLLQDPSSDL